MEKDTGTTRSILGSLPNPADSPTSCGSVAGLNYGRLLRKAQRLQLDKAIPEAVRETPDGGQHLAFHLSEGSAWTPEKSRRAEYRRVHGE